MAVVEISSPRPQVRLVTLNRPEKLNAMSTELIGGLHEALDTVGADPDCRVVVLTGAGRGFCAGLDLTGFGLAPGGEHVGPVASGFLTQQYIARLIPHLRSLRQPVIAAVNGPAAGGGFALALGSDIRIAAASARFNAAFVRIGLSACDIGVSWLLPRLVGASRAHELMLTGRLFDAAEAERIGLVTEVVPDGQVVEAALAKAEMICANSPFGIWMTKEVMWSNLEVASQQAAIDLENRTQILASQTADSREAMRAFLEKRPAEFTWR